jgi:DNA helicase-2/ATP-dependent DNA helicase PcrA
MTLRLIPLESQPPASSLLNGLNPQQELAVRTSHGPVLIIAGAGSGKTRVLTVRVAYLLEQGVPAHSVLALTFTNKAAQEMKERIELLVGGGVARGIWAGTFHSLFARILRRHAEKIGFTDAFTIYDAEDQLAAIKAAMVQLGISQQVMPPGGLRARISGAKNAMLSWQEMDRQATAVADRQAAQVYQEYEKRLRQSNAMDFDDLLLNTIRLLENEPDVLEHYHNRFTHILVDEYQDTNRAQYRVVNLLARKNRNLCVVGDDAQSIYRWRGAEIRNILDFERDYPEATVVRLEQNYRSTKTILAAADAVIRHNSAQLKKQLWTENAEGEKIALLSCRDDREEATAIVAAIRSRLSAGGYQYRDVAVLYRTNAQSQALEDALRRDNLPYHIVSGVSFYKRKEVKDTIAYLRLLVNPSDAESLLRVINEPVRGIGNTSLQRIQEYATRRGIALFDAMREAQRIEGLQKRIEGSVTEFVQLVDSYRDQLSHQPPAQLAQAFLEATGLPRMYQQQDNAEALDRWNNIERVLSHIAEQQELDADLTLATYLESVALVSEQDDPELGNNRVALMTMHAAKGLEFPVVVIAGLEQGLFPLAKAETDLGEQEEERRLFYVGLTRAREQLVLTYAERRYRFGELSFSRPSMFLSEIPPENFAPSSRPMAGGSGRRGTETGNRKPETGGQRPSAGGQRPTASSQRPSASGQQQSYSQLPASENYSQLPPEDVPASIPRRGVTSRPGGPVNQFRTGMRVKHPMFGVGQIESVSGTGQNAKATVLFFSGQRKQLMLAYARLEVV